MHKINLQYWRFINAVLIFAGIIFPWIKIVFDIQSVPHSPTPGWKFIFRMSVDVVNNLFTNEFELIMLPFLLMSLSGFGVILYLTFNSFSMIKDTNRRSNKIVSAILIGIVLVYSPLLLFGKPLLGYWLTNTGLLSGAILEWGVIQTGKP